MVLTTGHCRRARAACAAAGPCGSVAPGAPRSGRPDWRRSASSAAWAKPRRRPARAGVVVDCPGHCLVVPARSEGALSSRRTLESRGSELAAADAGGQALGGCGDRSQRRGEIAAGYEQARQGGGRRERPPVRGDPALRPWPGRASASPWSTRRRSSREFGRPAEYAYRAGYAWMLARSAARTTRWPHRLGRRGRLRPPRRRHEPPRRRSPSSRRRSRARRARPAPPASWSACCPTPTATSSTAGAPPATPPPPTTSPSWRRCSAATRRRRRASRRP